MEVRVVQFPEDLASLDLAEGDLLFDIVEDHQEMLAFLCVVGVGVGEGNYGAVVLHDDGGQFEGYTYACVRSS